MLGDRPACLARELTKKHEEVLRDRARALADRLEADPPRGECTLVVAGADESEVASSRDWSQEEVDESIRAALDRGDSVRDLATELAARSGRGRRDIYARAVELRERASGEGADDASDLGGSSP